MNEKEYFEINFERLRTLRREAREKQNTYSKVRQELQSVNIRLENLERLLSAEVHAAGNADLQAKLDQILEEEIESQNLTTAAAKDSKTNFLGTVLYKSNVTGKGLSPQELFENAKKENPNYSVTLKYVNNVIYKLRRRGLVEKAGDRYFLTELGMKRFAQMLENDKT